MKKSNVYTRTGDAGQTSLIGGVRVSKASARLEAYGTIDELSSQLGLLVTYLTDDHDRETVENVQRTLFHVSTLLATPPQEGKPAQSLDATLVEQLEHEIDEITASIPPFRCFIVPGGSRGAAVAHVCRTVCRRAERRIILLAEESPIDPILQSYVNRLSDFLFVLARKVNFLQDIEEKRVF
jgi:cob(I)alamin adenosyltransferase